MVPPSLLKSGFDVIEFLLEFLISSILLCRPLLIEGFRYNGGRDEGAPPIDVIVGIYPEFDFYI